MEWEFERWADEVKVDRDCEVEWRIGEEVDEVWEVLVWWG